MNEEIKNDRRTWLKWLMGSAVVATTLGFLGKSRKPKMVKMLTHDGKLVEIPENKISGSKRKVTRKELATWVWKHNDI